MKGVILAGGKGTRLLPMTEVVNKHLVPVLNKPMILYPLETLKLYGVTDILVISNAEHIGAIAELLGDGARFGVDLTYRVQKEAGGTGQALGLARDFAREKPIMMVLGDNVFDTRALPKSLPKSAGSKNMHFFFAPVKDPTRFGVPVFSRAEKLIAIEEKPKQPKSSFAVTGLYVYPPDVFSIIENLEPSERGEIETTGVSNWYIQNKRASHSVIDGFWSDAGTRDSLKKVIDWAFKSKQ